MPSRETGCGHVNASQLPLKRNYVDTKTYKRFSPYNLKTATLHRATGAAAMRNGETHFDQVPMEVVETVVRRAAALAAMREKSPELVSELDRQAGREFLKGEKKLLLFKRRL